MARFLVTNGQTFEPFSFEEIIKPLAYTQERHDAAQDAYDKLSMDTESLANYISENEDDRVAKAMYDNYREKLSTLQYNLWKYGVTAQTRRDLAAARNGYASDIQRLGKAIETRQLRSKEYWDAAHKDKDLIMGSDPASFGLDNYLSDDTFGSNWFSYSGNQFMAEVGADAKARALELRRNVVNENEVPGYITRIAQVGFTEDEVNKALNAVRSGAYKHIANGPIKILAETLADHIAATGAILGKNISEEQYNRFFDYGRTGLAQGILGKDVKDFADVEYRRAIKGDKSDGGDDENPVIPMADEFFTNTNPEPLQSSDYGEYAEFYDKHNKKFKDGKTLELILPDDSTVVANNFIDATNYIYDSLARQNARLIFGADVALPGENFWGTKSSKQEILKTDDSGKMIKLITGNINDEDASRLRLNALATDAGIPGFNDFVGLYQDDSKKNLNEEATREFNKYRLEHMKHVNDIKKKNPDIDIDDYALNPKDERDLRGGSMGADRLPQNISFDDVMNIIATKNFVKRATPATLVSSDSADNFVRENFANNMIKAFSDLVASEGEIIEGSDDKPGTATLKKGSKNAFEILGPGLMRSNQNVLDLSQIFQRYKDGKSIRNDALGSIEFNPYDIAEDPKNPKFRFTSTQSVGRKYRAGIGYLGDFVKNVFMNKTYNGKGKYSDSVNGVETPADAIAYMMQPLSNPEEFMKMDMSEADEWYNNTRSYLGLGRDDMSNPRDFVRDSSARNFLYEAIVGYINAHLSYVLNTYNNMHPTHTGLQSNKMAGVRTIE